MKALISERTSGPYSFDVSFIILLLKRFLKPLENVGHDLLVCLREVRRGLDDDGPLFSRCDELAQVADSVSISGRCFADQLRDRGFELADSFFLAVLINDDLLMQSPGEHCGHVECAFRTAPGIARSAFFKPTILGRLAVPDFVRSILGVA